MVQDLTLQIRQINDITVDQTNASDSRGGQVEGRRRTKPPGADQENFGLGDFLLALSTDLGQENMPAVAAYLLFGKFHISTRCRNGVRLRALFLTCALHHEKRVPVFQMLKYFSMLIYRSPVSQRIVTMFLPGPNSWATC